MTQLLSYEERDGRPLSDKDERQVHPPSSSSQQISPTTTTSTTNIQENVKANRSSHRSASGTASHTSSSASLPAPRIVFATDSKYDNWIWVILSCPLVLIFIQFTLVLVTMDKKADVQRSQTAWILGWTMIMILAIYMVVLPKQIDVRSNGTIGVKTFLFTYQFNHISRAYQAEFGAEDWLRPRLRFVTTLEPQYRVVIRRRGGRSDLVLSPTRTEDFLKALENVIAMEDENPTSNPISESKPDLSTV